MYPEKYFSAILEEMNAGYDSFNLQSVTTQYFDIGNFEGRQKSYRSSTRVACDPRLEDAAMDCLIVSLLEINEPSVKLNDLVCDIHRPCYMDHVALNHF